MVVGTGRRERTRLRANQIINRFGALSGENLDKALLPQFPQAPQKGLHLVVAGFPWNTKRISGSLCGSTGRAQERQKIFLELVVVAQQPSVEDETEDAIG